MTDGLRNRQWSFSNKALCFKYGTLKTSQMKEIYDVAYPKLSYLFLINSKGN